MQKHPRIFKQKKFKAEMMMRGVVKIITGNLGVCFYVILKIHFEHI